MDAARPLDAARPVDAVSPMDAARPIDAAKTGDAAETGDAVNHFPPSPTPIPQLDGDAPEQDDPESDNPGPDLNRDPDLDTDLNADDDDVFNSINCKNANELCGNEMCDSLNYGIVKASDYEDLKDAKICTNYREWRKCPKHVHLPTKDCILRYLFPR